jgi:hypothetical protein
MKVPAASAKRRDNRPADGSEPVGRIAPLKTGGM